MRNTLLAAAAFALLALGTPAEARVVTTQVVRGRLHPVADDSRAHGQFVISVQSVRDRSRERLDVVAAGLDATKDGDGNLPDYRCWVVNADRSVAADFGSGRVSEGGRFRFRFASPRQEFPDGVSSLVDFAGGQVQVRLGEDLVLAGDIPEFLGIDDDNEGGSGAAARAWGIHRLRATDAGGDAKGFVSCLYVNRPRVTVEALRVECLGLARIGDTFTVVVIDGDGAETELGTMVARTRFGVGILHLSTRAGDEIPGGGVLAMGGFRLEVRAADGTAWLVGRFPDLTR